MTRRPTGGRIDRATSLDFTFDGVGYTGHPGDTLASALLAQGVSTVARSTRLGRPRGIFTAGIDEPNALVRLDGPVVDPMIPATVVELVDGLVAHPVRGRGDLGETPDPARYDSMHLHADVLVVGAGPAGLAAALEAARSGARVVVVDDQSEFGGSSLGLGGDEAERLAATVAELATFADVRLLPRTTAFGYYDDGFVLARQNRTDHLGAAAPAGAVRQRVWRIRAGHVVVATGAHERTIAFAGNDRPGVMLAGAARTYLHRYGVLVGDRIVVFTTHDGAYEAAVELAAAGAEVTVVDPRARTAAAALCEQRGIEVRFGQVVTATTGPERVSAVHVAAHDTAAGRNSASTIPCDTLLVSGGWNPAVHLFSQARGTLRWDDAACALRPDSTVRGMSVVGAAAGDVPPPAEPPMALWSVATNDAGPDTRFVDLQRDATVADVLRATGAGLESVEHVKRYTTIGTAHDQGKTSGVLSSGLVAETLGRELASIGTTTFRPPYTPVPFAALAGRDRGELFDPVRTTALHAWHVEQGAVFENVGQWHRPQYYPRPGEDADAAVARETRAARTGVGIMDASTLGKIDVQGRDAGEFLDRLYTNLMSTLKPGHVRYGVMCGLDGMVFDDGTVMRLDEQRFVLTTTTGNAAGVLDRMEEFAQTEWPDLDVWLTSVTEHWATAAVVGPRSREVIAAVAPDLDVSREGFGFMTWRDAQVAGVDARVCRISFSGELAYEVNVARPFADGVWRALVAAGEPYGITAYGTDAMHVLRAEKGYPIIGQDTDGTVTPHDLGLSWAVSKKKSGLRGQAVLLATGEPATRSQAPGRSAAARSG